MAASILARFRTMPGVGQQPGHVAGPERGHGRHVEAGERGPEVLPLAQDGQPGQAGLERLQAEPLVQAPVVADRACPTPRRGSST